MTAQIVVAYDATDPSATAHAADRALEGLGCFVSRSPVADEICIVARNAPFTCAEHLRAGQQLVIESSGTWRVEQVPAVAL